MLQVFVRRRCIAKIGLSCYDMDIALCPGYFEEREAESMARKIVGLSVAHAFYKFMDCTALLLKEDASESEVRVKDWPTDGVGKQRVEKIIIANDHLQKGERRLVESSKTIAGQALCETGLVQIQCSVSYTMLICSDLTTSTKRS